jgi:serine/threonine protein kinase
MNQDDLVGLFIDDKYRLDRKIGEGGMGAVYLSTQLMVDRNVAIKVLHAGLHGHEKLKQRFEVEAKAIGRLHHPHCITLFDFGYSQEMQAFYTVMEYLEGEALHKRLGTGVNPREALMIVRQIALGLDHAHHQGILHRDLKPENIMLAKMTDGSELVKVLDFGIARVFQAGSADSSQEMSNNNRLTRAGEIFGTPAYISPEQARGERDLTPASDIYSMGVMLYELLEGRLPYWGESPIDTIMMHIRDPVPKITRLEVPASVKALVMQLLAKDPLQRPQTGKRVAELIDQAVMEGSLSQVPVNMFSADTGMHASMPASALSPAARQELGLDAAPAAPSASHSYQRTLLDVRPDLGDVDEWEDAPATKISTPPQPMHNTMPPGSSLPVGFGAQSAGPPIGFGHPNAGPPLVGFGPPPAMQAAQAGPHRAAASSAGRPEPRVVALDYEAMRPVKTNKRWLFPAIIMLLMVIAGGVGGLAYMNVQESDALIEAQRAAAIKAEAERLAAEEEPEEPSEAPPTAIKPPPTDLVPVEQVKEDPPSQVVAPPQADSKPEPKPEPEADKPKPKSTKPAKKNTKKPKEVRPAPIQLF